MKQDEIIGMAQEAFQLPHCEVYVDDLKRFAALVAAHEREACAKLCLKTGIKHPQQTGQEACAAAIRARGEK